MRRCAVLKKRRANAEAVRLPPGSKVRLFNLATDVPTATLTSGGKTLASGVKYTLGSIPWAPVPAALASFSAAARSESAENVGADSTEGSGAIWRPEPLLSVAMGIAAGGSPGVGGGGMSERGEGCSAMASSILAPAACVFRRQPRPPARPEFDEKAAHRK